LRPVLPPLVIVRFLFGAGDASADPMNMFRQLGEFICTVLFGYLVGRYDDYLLPLFVIGEMVALGAFLFTRIDAGRPFVRAGTDRTGSYAGLIIMKMTRRFT
jgi:hypothetical protein